MKGLILSFFAILLITTGCSEVEFKTVEDQEKGFVECIDCKEDEITENGLRKVDLSITFENSVSNQADILFVIDNSGSMTVDLEELSSKFNNFIASINTLDWRICATTTDNSNNGTKGDLLEFSDESIYLQKGDAEAQAKFVALIDSISGDGSGDEEGVQAINNAVTNNEGCFRAGASLNTVVISDENENSMGMDLDATSEPANLLANIDETFGAAKVFSHHSIVIRSSQDDNLDGLFEPDTVCQATQNQDVIDTFPNLDPNGTYAHFGTVYETLSNLTQGVIGNICAADYSNQLKFIGDATVANTIGSKSLECEPVDIDGNPITKAEDLIASTTSQSPLSISIDGNAINVSSADAGMVTVALSYYCKVEEDPVVE